jgi:hypothetical protein
VKSAEDFPRRQGAVAALSELGIPERHVTSGSLTKQHGHPGVCCCWSQSCRDRTCNVNALILDAFFPDNEQE